MNEQHSFDSEAKTHRPQGLLKNNLGMSRIFPHAYRVTYQDVPVVDSIVYWTDFTLETETDSPAVEEKIKSEHAETVESTSVCPSNPRVIRVTYSEPERARKTHDSIRQALGDLGLLCEDSPAELSETRTYTTVPKWVPEGGDDPAWIKDLHARGQSVQLGEVDLELTNTTSAETIPLIAMGDLILLKGRTCLNMAHAGIGPWQTRVQRIMIELPPGCTTRLRVFYMSFEFRQSLGYSAVCLDDKNMQPFIVTRDMQPNFSIPAEAGCSET
jgi:hypothetical protein